MVWLIAIGCGFPLANFDFSLISYNNLKKDKITSWDKSTEISVIHKPNSPLKIIVFSVLLIGIILLNAYLSVVEKLSRF